MSEILDNVYHKYVVIVFGAVVFGTVFSRTLLLRGRGNFFSDENFFKILYVFFLSKKTGHLVLEKLPQLRRG